MLGRRFYGVVCSLVKGNNVNCYVAGGVVCKVEMMRNLFRFVIFVNITKRKHLVYIS